MMWEGLSPPYGTIVADPPWHYDEGRIVGWSRGLHEVRPMPYGTMSLDEISGLGVGQLATPGAHLYLWTTQRFVWDAPSVLKAWGWGRPRLLTWAKPLQGEGPGSPFASTTEFLLFARRPVGSTIRDAREVRGLSQSDLDLAVNGKVTRITKRWEDDDCLPGVNQWRRITAALALDLPDITPPPAQGPTTWWGWPRGRHSEKPAAAYDEIERVSSGPYVDLFARRQRLGWDSWGHGYEIGAA